MNNILYGVKNSDNRQLDLFEITVHNTVVASVKDSEDNTYYGDAVLKNLSPDSNVIKGN